jgi:calcium-dependent protein kinase
VLKRSYGPEADIWSCGVMLYILLSGFPPFFGQTTQQIFRAILNDQLDLASKPWDTISSHVGAPYRGGWCGGLRWQLRQQQQCVCVGGGGGSATAAQAAANAPLSPSPPFPLSAQAKECVKCMLVRNPRRRATAQDILNNEWMRENGAASEEPLQPEILHRMRQFAGMNRLKREALRVRGWVGWVRVGRRV